MVRRTIGVVIGLALIAACRGDDAGDAARGRGLAAATLASAQQAAVYEAAVRGAFDPSPSLSLLLYPQLLPRAAGYGGAPAVPTDVATELRRRGVVRGDCGPWPDSVSTAKHAPRCAAPMAGYVVRVSPILALGPDSVEVYLYATRYDTPGGAPHPRFSFEKAYQLVRRDGAWRVVREGRVARAARARERARRG